MNTPSLSRDRSLQNLPSTENWDIAIIGGGATGLGIALDAASRGLKTILLEQHDFAKGTSSRSTKLVHGGVRYLAMGDVKLVYAALRERGIIFKNAPHLAHAQSFIIPCYSFLSKWKYLIGLKIYDWLAGHHRIGKSTYVTKQDIKKRLPGIKTEKLQGGVCYFDGQFDDARMAINLAQTATKHGATLINYAKVTALAKNEQGKISGLSFVDQEKGEKHEINARVIINATGVFVDDILRLDTATHKPLVRPSQGTHIVVDRSFLGNEDALMIPETSDGRVLFGVPWHNHLLLGTTDIPIDQHSEEPRPLDQEIAFILDTAANYLNRPPQLSDVRSIFAGLRPLAAPDKDSDSTKEISRDHKLIINDSGLITITGGKWTTYRKMAEETVDKAISTSGFEKVACLTQDIKINGYTQEKQSGHWGYYGSDANKIQAMATAKPELNEKLHPKFEHIGAEVAWAVETEMARTVEDVLARRLRILFLDAAAALEMAPKTAEIMAKSLNKDQEWIDTQLHQFEALVKRYLPD
ncbi:glycerol-3-phosphate dehydrogenase/oxidase [Parapedobacter tibetensis]|uniref:glycerol-3-phosphate dehydrogenase/oxidase n=1 Tax=Parapedobacter tibetensis TaxID=2972951 RepID=UPI00214DCA5E|nr:glycerol-3-phosphate dehydrogenase/oxidase [Parapedobacter tibetensis]